MVQGAYDESAQRSYLGGLLALRVISATTAYSAKIIVSSLNNYGLWRMRAAVDTGSLR